MEMTVTEYREQKKERAKQLAKHTKSSLVDKLMLGYDTIRRLETKLQNTSANIDYAKCTWTQLIDGLNSYWISSCDGRAKKETFKNCCPICGKLVLKSFS